MVSFLRRRFGKHYQLTVAIIVIIFVLTMANTLMTTFKKKLKEKNFKNVTEMLNQISTGRIFHTRFEVREEETLFCTDILKATKNGRWLKKPNLTHKDIKARDLMDITLRRHRGQPESLIRNDFRCGTKYPIPAPHFGPDMPAMCSREGNRYCCNADGWCSHGPSNCSCAKCTDFRKIVSAELHEWTPTDCRIRNYSSEEACSMVNERLSSLVVIGDSLMRHFYAALMLVFTDDFHEGALLANRKDCRGERQFVDRGKANCHGALARNSTLKRGKFCKGRAKFYFAFNESYALAYREQAFAKIKENLNRANSLILLGIGLHDGLNAEFIMFKLVEPILKLIGGKKWPRIVWVTIHAQGFLKPLAYCALQNDHKIYEYNRLMTKKLREKGVNVFDVFNMTKGVYSYDGTHYGYGMNMIKAQYLLNYIHQSIQPRI